VNAVLVDASACLECGLLYPATTTGASRAAACCGIGSELRKAYQCACGSLFEETAYATCQEHCFCVRCKKNMAPGATSICYDCAIDQRIARAMQDRQP